jgi:hypothetical protein
MRAPVAQRTRASVFGTGGRGFESLQARHRFVHERLINAVILRVGKAHLKLETEFTGTMPVGKHPAGNAGLLWKLSDYLTALL